MGSCSSVHRNSICSKTVDKLVIPPSPIKEKPKNGNFPVEDVALKSQSSPSQSSTTTPFNASKEEAFFDSKAWIDSDCEDDFYSVNGAPIRLRPILGSRSSRSYLSSRMTSREDEDEEDCELLLPRVGVVALDDFQALVHHFTPSLGTTPVHHTFGTPSVNKTPSEHTVPATFPEPFPTEKKKNLLELFRESVREIQNDVDDDVGNTSIDEQQKEVKPIIHDLTKSAQSTPYISGGNYSCSSDRTMNDDHASSSIREKSVKPVQCCITSLASCGSFSERRRKTSPAIAANGKA